MSEPDRPDPLDFGRTMAQSQAQPAPDSDPVWLVHHGGRQSAPPQVPSPDPFDSGRTVAHPSSSATPIQPGSQSPGPSPTPRTPGQPGQPVSGDLRPGTIVDDRFVVTKRLGRGGMGVVYKVVDKETEVEYAIKVLAPEIAGSPDMLRLLRKEVANAQLLTHQNLLRIIDLVWRATPPFILMECIDGEDLEAYRLRKGGKLPIEEVRRVAGEVIAGLGYLHDKGLVHLDLKPQNILVSKAGEIKIADFGISRTIKDQVQAQREDASQVPLGTLCFMAPEQLMGDVCDRRADYYALGVILYVLTEGKPPMPTDSRGSVVKWALDSNKELGSAAWLAPMLVPRAEDRQVIDLKASVQTTAPSVSRRGTTPGDRAELTLPGGVKMAFRWCPPGSFTMGSPPSEEGRHYDEDQVQVSLSRGFWMGETEVTQAQWRAVMGTDPSHFKGNNLPVEQVSWYQAAKFCSKLSSHSGLTISLPTEAQWEYACRAGTTTPFHFGSTVTPDQVNYDGNYPYGSAAKGVFREKTTPVGGFPANAWGLRDMHGNVWEWCVDWYGDSLPGGTDPTGPSTGSLRVIRGGCWGNYAQRCRSAYRGNLDPASRGSSLGFRVISPVK
jgi:formylglycine-generating enzyme required for sulfatase activity